MRIPYPCKPQQAAAKTPGRYAFNVAHYVPELGGKPCIAATDGHMLAVVPVTLDDDDGFNGTPAAIPAEVMKAATKRTEPRVTFHAEAGDDRLEVAGMAVKIDASQADFPVETVTRECCPTKPPTGVRVALNAAMLARLAKALGSDQVVLQLPEPSKVKGGRQPYGSRVPDSLQVADAVLVRPCGEHTTPGAFGLIMPIVNAVVAD